VKLPRKTLGPEGATEGLRRVRGENKGVRGTFGSPVGERYSWRLRRKLGRGLTSVISKGGAVQMGDRDEKKKVGQGTENGGGTDKQPYLGNKPRLGNEEKQTVGDALG